LIFPAGPNTKFIRVIKTHYSVEPALIGQTGKKHPIFTSAFLEIAVLLFGFEFTQIYRNILVMLPVFLYGCETWSLTMREEHRLKVFENRELRKIFGSERGGVTGNLIKPHNEEHYDLYCSQNVIGV
jgi:hypothetical protein